MMETFFNVSEQTQLFLWACVLGAFTGIFYDIFRVLRILIKHNSFVVFIEDIIFTLFFGMSLFIFATEKARGEVRFFMLFGALLGFIIYYMTIGFLMVNIIKRIIGVIKKVMRLLYKHLFAHILRFFSDVAKKLRIKFVEVATKLKKVYFTNKKPLKEDKHIVYNKHKSRRVKTKRSDNRNGKKKGQEK